MKGQMTSRERILAAMDLRPVDRIPLDYWGTEEATSKFIRGLGVENELELWETLNVDKIMGIEGRYIGPELISENETTSDIWGVRYKTVFYAENEGSYQEIFHHPLEKFESIDDIEANYVWPKADWFDFLNIADQCGKYPYHAIGAGYAAPFFMYTNIRGMEQTLIDFAADEEMADYILTRICDFLYEYHERLFEAGNGRIDISELTDDFGTQTGMIISPGMFDKYFKQRYQRLAKLYKHYGIRVFHHDDGAIMPLIPTLIDIGINVLNPIQWHLPGMDLKELKLRFGKKLCFHGGVDNQSVLPFGTVKDVEKEAMECLEILGEDRTGYIFAPCHNIQVITPVENIIAMYKTAREFNENRF